MNVIKISASDFRKNMFRLLNQVINENYKIMIQRPDGEVLITKNTLQKQDKFSKIPYLNAVAVGVGDSDLINHKLADWTEEPNVT